MHVASGSTLKHLAVQMYREIQWLVFVHDNAQICTRLVADKSLSHVLVYFGAIEPGKRDTRRCMIYELGNCNKAVEDRRADLVPDIC